MLAREKRELLKQMDRFANENTALLKKITKRETEMAKINAKNNELMERCRKMAEENTALHLENARMRAKAKKSRKTGSTRK
eukprot:CAMPEP_0197527606 /NCGR_PEP_ID=MMETSP1318-20131121/22319_1 /TAXON_ID=552666 /ORGANISM="Partenskyella glossopodia, Strain RCC365" /LENGTH=80 /DNA_ID=CAMNT_0043082353 /DNA_START=214 /DNA_END=456 /DNA_ORIENTATION=+